MKTLSIIGMNLCILSLATVCFSTEIPAASLMVKDYEGISYVSGGIGLDERDKMKAITSGYDLKLVFATKDGKYVADIAVAVKDATGKIVLDAVSDGPWFFAKLPAGKYTVTATMGEKTEHQPVEIKSAGQAILYFYCSE